MEKQLGTPRVLLMTAKKSQALPVTHKKGQTQSVRTRLRSIAFREVTERERDIGIPQIEHFFNTSCYMKEFPLFVPERETRASWLQHARDLLQHQHQHVSVSRARSSFQFSKAEPLHFSHAVWEDV